MSTACQLGASGPVSDIASALDSTPVTVIGLDDTDSKEEGLCTTYVAAKIADGLEKQGAAVERCLLVRCNPAVEHKTRGNAALSVHTDADPVLAMDVLEAALTAARTDDPATNPGGVVAPGNPAEVPEAVAGFASDAVCDILDVDTALTHAVEAGYETISLGNGRGVIGALAAVGAYRAFEEWTHECIAYRERDRWGTERTVDRDSVFAAAEGAYPAAWDSVDRVEGHAVCVPRTPCPVLHAIRGEDPAVVKSVSRAIEGEPVAERASFVTNQGTDAHLSRVDAAANVVDGRSFRLTATVSNRPETGPGGHVFFSVEDGSAELDCVAFEPTKRFRDHVRALRPGDCVTVCGEVGEGTLKLEKFALRDRVETVAATPECPECGRSMTSAGRNQGYRCRDCGTAASAKVERPVERAIDPGWYEVPPCARRHVAKPLVRGDFDAPVHPER